MSALPELDPFDRKILAILQRDNRTSQQEIGEAVALSTAAVNRRIRRMEALGVISANVAILDPVKVGRPVTLVVGLSVNSERPAVLADTKARLAAAAEVQQCYYVTGDFDLILVLTVESMAAYEVLTQLLFSSDENIARFRTFVVMDRVKATLGCPA
jgi:DNA-binding Lrp family transcriptional regulator